MSNPDIARQRLHNLHVSAHRFKTAQEMVQWSGAIQAQEYPSAKWAIGLRITGVSDAKMEQAFTEGSILRTHVMRPTWHFVAPADIRWMLALTAPNVYRAMNSTTRKLNLDDATYRKCNAILTKALEGGKQLTRSELSKFLHQAGIDTTDLLRLTYLVMHAELDGVICSGARRGKQFTYALLDERAPGAKILDRDEALAELTKRYYMSHGPATLKDYVWWSGLNMADARAGLEMVKAQLEGQKIGQDVYWSWGAAPEFTDATLTAYLLPSYDEFTVGYTDRSATLEPDHVDKLNSRENNILNHVIVMNNQIVGTWKRTFNKDRVTITPKLLRPLTSLEHQAFVEAANRYGEFLGMSVALLM